VFATESTAKSRASPVPTSWSVHDVTEIRHRDRCGSGAQRSHGERRPPAGQIQALEEIPGEQKHRSVQESLDCGPEDARRNQRGTTGPVAMPNALARR
jgi:hypothetical protein